MTGPGNLYRTKVKSEVEKHILTPNNRMKFVVNLTMVKC